MRVAVTVFGLDLFTLDIDTSAAGDDVGDCTTYPVPVGFTVPEREWDEPED